MRHLVTVLVILLVAGCGGAPRHTAGPATGSTTGATTAAGAVATAADAVNAADVMFLQMMAEHHRQSIEIARLAGRQASREEVRTLAEAIAVTMAADVYSMNERLHSWEQPLSASADEHAAHGGMPGATKEKITALHAAGRGDFDRDFLNLMIAQHGDAVRMAEEEVSTGANPQAVELAGRLSKAQAAQIDHMRGLLTSIGAPSRSGRPGH
jgi:uncharacterized protein (DUF305 family)